MFFFYNIKRYFLSKYFILYKFCKNIFFYNKNCILSKVIGLNLSETILLFLDLVFLYYFSIFQ